MATDEATLFNYRFNNTFPFSRNKCCGFIMKNFKPIINNKSKTIKKKQNSIAAQEDF
jgi:hypothetical protein